MKRATHWRERVPIRPGFQGRVACGSMVEHDRATLVWTKVTCGRCRKSLAFESVVVKYLRSRYGHVPLDEVVRLTRRVA